MEQMEVTPSTAEDKAEAGPSSAAIPSKAERKQLLSSLPKKKKSVRMKEKKLRDQNRLRKLIAPKHALLAINEIKGVTMSEFKYSLASTSPAPSFICEATINGVAYKGKGPSKNASKTDLCDQALRDIMIQKMWTQSRAIDEDKELGPDEEIPIIPLVSYAIHKLFVEWESEGYCMKCAGSKERDPDDPCICDGTGTPVSAAQAAKAAVDRAEITIPKEYYKLAANTPSFAPKEPVAANLSAPSTSGTSSSAAPVAVPVSPSAASSSSS